MSAFDTVMRHVDVLRASWVEQRKQEREAKKGLRAKAHELEFLPAVLEVTETPASPAGRFTALAIAAFFLIALAWSFIGEIDVIAIAQGRVISSIQVQTIQPLESGVVRRIHVKEGERVRRGQVLVELDPTGTEADEARLVKELAALTMEVARLEALIADDPARAFVPPTDTPPRIVAEIRAFILSQWREQKAKIAALEGELSRYEAEAQTIDAEIGRLQKLLPITRERVEGKRGLSQNSLLPKLAFLELEEQLVEREGQLEIQKRRLAETQATVATARARRAQVEAEYQRDILSRLTDARTKVGSLEQEIRKARERHRLQTLLTPVDGTVQQLAIHTEGGVVTPAQLLMAVVPADSELEIEARVLNKDIGFVRDGQDAEIKVESFNFTRYGTIEGSVRHVSPDSVMDEKEGLIYPTRVTLSRKTMVIDGKEIALQPGMSVTIEIKTGKRTVIDYLLSPIKRYKHESMRER